MNDYLHSLGIDTEARQAEAYADLKAEARRSAYARPATVATPATAATLLPAPPAPTVLATATMQPRRRASF
jgi:hypothetical protein